MKIGDVQKALDYIVRPGIKQDGASVPFLVGKPGIGKSHIVKAHAKKYGMKLIDLRLSLVDSSEVRGIPYPDHEKKLMRIFPPDTMPFTCNKEFDGTSGILFLDEINRANPMTLQAIFQLVYDRCIDKNKLLDSWFIVAAGNLGYEDGTDVIEMDAALKGRFDRFLVEEDLESWLNWAKGANVAQSIINFIDSHPAYLYKEMNKEEKAFVTPRHWERLSNIFKNNAEFSQMQIMQDMGFSVLDSAAPTFIEYLRTLKDVSPKMVLEEYDEVKETLMKFERPKLHAINAELVAYVKDLKFDKLDKKTKMMVTNFHKYVKDFLNKDNFYGVIVQLVASNELFVDKYLTVFPEEEATIQALLNTAYEKKPEADKHSTPV